MRVGSSKPSLGLLGFDLAATGFCDGGSVTVAAADDSGGGGGGGADDATGDGGAGGCTRPRADTVSSGSSSKLPGAGEGGRLTAAAPRGGDGDGDGGRGTAGAGAD